MISMVAPDGRQLMVPEDQVERLISLGAKISNDKPTRSIAKSALRQAGRLGRAAATGIAGIADIPNLGALGLHAAGLKETPTFYEPIGSKVQKGIDTLTGGNLAPENKAEEYMDIIGEGLAPLALAPLTGGASLTGTVARGLAKRGTQGLVGKSAQKLAKIGSNPYKPTASNIAGSVGSSAALKAYLDEGGDPNLIGPLLASMAGGAGARGALKLKNPMNSLAEGVGRATGFSPEKYAQNAAVGLPVTPATVSKRKLPGYIEMVAAKIPASMGTLDKFYKRREAATASNLGISTPKDLEHAVANIPKHLAKEGAEGYHGRASNIYERRGEKFNNRVQEAFNNKETVDISDIINELENKRLLRNSKSRFDKTKEGILLKELKDSIVESPQSLEAASLFKELKKQGLSDDAIERIIKSELGDIEVSQKRIGLQDLEDLREKALQESIESKTPLGAGTPKSKRAAERSQMLAGKRYQFMEEIGTPSEIHNAREARKFWSSYKDEKNGMSKYVAKLTGADNDAAAFQKLTSKNPKFIKLARQGLSKNDRHKLSEAIIADLGTRQGRFDINTAYTNFKKLETPVQQEFLKTLPNSATRHNFERTMKFIGDNKKMMETLANTSNTAHTNHVLGLMKKYGVVTAAAVMGYGIIPLIVLAATDVGLNLGSRIWTSQKFLRRMNDVISAKNATGQTNKLDLLLKSVGQTGRHTKHMEQ